MLTSTELCASDAVQNLLKYLGLGACERTDKVPEGKSSHTLFLAGRFRGGAEILSKVRLALDPADQTVTMNIIVRYDVSPMPWPHCSPFRSEDSAVSELIGSAIA